MQTRVRVLGATGMLGSMAARYFVDRGAELVPSTRDTGRPNDLRPELFRGIRSVDITINAIGAIPQRVTNPATVHFVNTILPAYARLHSDGLFVHASSDCVFGGTGTVRARDVEERPDATDDYGRSKAAAEALLLTQVGRPCDIIRCSIVGPGGSGAGLMGWFLRQRGRVIGYTDRFWNGITTLAWCQLAEALAEEGSVDPTTHGTRLVQAGTLGRVSKYDLLCAMRDAFGLDIDIVPAESGVRVSRVLDVRERSGHSQKMSTRSLAPISEQLREMRDFMDRTESGWLDRERMR